MVAAAGAVGVAGGGLVTDDDCMATDGGDVAAGGGGGKLHCTRTAPASASVTIRQAWTGDEPSPPDLI
jgi:hypothetical protein